MSLSVLQVAYPFAPVGPDAVGGAEQVLSRLDIALTRAGHRSIVVARDGSVVAGQLESVALPIGPLSHENRRKGMETHRKRIESVLREHHVDLIHMHGIDFNQYLPDTQLPILVTLHLPPDWYPQEIFQSQRRNLWMHCVSASQRRACPQGAMLLPDIENGVDLDEFNPASRRGRFALCLGRICPEKNFHVAIDAGKRANLPVLIAGQLFPYPEHEEYFTRELLPRLDRLRRFIGPAGFQRKRRLLASAQCLLIPSLAQETSSLVAMEALASGTPVIAYPSGALRDLIQEGITGFFVSSEIEMTQAISKVGKLSPQICRDTAMRRFSSTNCIENYLKVYSQLVNNFAHGKLYPRSSAAPSVNEIRTLDALEGLHSEWSVLWKQDRQATPFQSPQWLIPWWRQFGSGELRVIAVRQHSKLIGLLPCFIPIDRSIGRRQLLLLGTGNSDYLGGIFSTEHRESAASTALEFLSKEDFWDECDFLQLRSDSVLLEKDTGLLTNRTDSENCPILSLPENSADLSKHVPASMLKYLEYCRRRIRRIGKFETFSATTGNLDSLRAALFRLHTERWTTQGHPGVLSTTLVESFHAESMRQLIELGVLRLFALALDGEIFAVLYAFADMRPCVRRFFYYLSGFSPGYKACSPGVLAIGHAVYEAINEGALEFDFLRGREAYKYDWGARDECTRRLRLWSPTGVN
jgi:glycosyltransferase involved in cell wall biosynthesis/CelD/BcsL family acetyltransferase involved in cellulose biosynthesis